MLPSEFYWSLPQGLKIYAYEWNHAKPTHGVVCLVHGLGEYSGRYAHVAEYLNQHGYAFMAYDLPGHGRSEGRRGHIPSFDSYLDEIDYLLQEARNRHPGLPLFLYGHSLGGNIVMAYALKRNPQIAGVISTSPVTFPADMPKLKLLMGKFFYKLLPTFSMNNGLDLSGLSRDPAVVKAYKADPLVHPWISARLGLDMLNSGTWITDHTSELTIPLLMMQGLADRIVSVEGTREMAKNAPPQLITFKEWEGGYHELHNDIIKEEVLEFMLKWLEVHII
jgi:alpha-beta hydrolase superfamily lysophospholipase